jgi:hypothetical protein
MKASRAAKTGPVVKLMVLEMARGMKAMAEYWHDLETRAREALRNRALIC